MNDHIEVTKENDEFAGIVTGSGLSWYAYTPFDIRVKSTLAREFPSRSEAEAFLLGGRE